MTSRAQILAAARRLIEHDGWERVTVRGLAAELGIGPATVYHHVRDKEGLLLLVLNEYAAQIPRPHLPDEPHERIVVAAQALHEALAEWPWIAEVLTTDGFIAVMGDPAIWTVEAIVDAAIEAGCDLEQAVVVFRSIWYYTVGEILVRAHSATRTVRESGSPSAGRFFGELDPEQRPRLAAIGDRWPVIAARDTFRQGLEALVDGLLAAGRSAESRRPADESSGR